MLRDPNINDSIKLGDKEFLFSEASNAPGIIYAEIGRKAKVYRLLNDSKTYALKVFKPKYRSRNSKAITKKLAKYRSIPGLAVTQRLVIDPKEYPEIIRQNENFSYAILMPWIEGKSWFNYVTAKIRITKKQSWTLSQALVSTLEKLEQNNLAHCDLSSSNFIFSHNFTNVELIDIEDMFGNNLVAPKAKSTGTSGYAPSWFGPEGVWEAAADRFSGAILLSEILCWQFEDIRKASDGDTFFAEGEFGYKSKRFRMLSDRLSQVNPEFSKLFSTVWFSKALEDCPKLADWKAVFDDNEEAVPEPQIKRPPRQTRTPKKHSTDTDMITYAESQFDRSSRFWWGFVYIVLVLFGIILVLACLSLTASLITS